MKANLFFSIVLFLIMTVTACNNKKQESASATKDQTGMMGMNMGSATAMMRKGYCHLPQRVYKHDEIAQNESHDDAHDETKRSDGKEKQ